MISSETNYRNLLKRELDLRCAANPRYSLRAFARDLGSTPSMLSQVLAGKRGLSLESAVQAAERLGWNEEETRYFCALVESQHSRSRIRRETALEKVKQYSSKNPGRTLELDAFQIIADSEHFAIRETLQLSNVQGDPEKIAARLGLVESKVIEILERMQNLELVEKVSNGTWKACEETVFTADGIPSAALRKYHTQVLARASKAMHEQDIEERHYISSFLALDPRHLPEIKAELRAFNQSLMDRFGSAKRATETYAFGLQFFRVTEKSKTTPNLKTKKSVKWSQK
jgi:uncharacterized protein (TIGR02147 family)